MARSTLCKKLYGQTDWRVPEILDAANVLDLSLDDVNQIFFDGRLRANDYKEIHAHWVGPTRVDGVTISYKHCTHCGWVSCVCENICPHCKAIMDEEIDNE